MDRLQRTVLPPGNGCLSRLRGGNGAMLLPSPLSLLEREHNRSTNPSRQHVSCSNKPIEFIFDHQLGNESPSSAWSCTNSIEASPLTMDQTDDEYQHQLLQRRPREFRRDDMYLELLHQLWARGCYSQHRLPGKNTTGGSISVGDVLQMINESAGSTAAPENFVLLTLTSFPFRIVYAPSELKTLFQAEMVGAPLFKHVSPTHALVPATPLVGSESAPLPPSSTACLLDGVFECNARATPVIESIASSPYSSEDDSNLIFFAVVVHDVQTPVDTMFCGNR